IKLMIGLELTTESSEPAEAVDTSVLGKVTIEQVLEKYVEAMGGKAAIEKVTSRVERGRFEIAGLALSGPVEIYGKAPDKRLIRYTVPGQAVLSEGFNGAIG